MAVCFNCYRTGADYMCSFCFRCHHLCGGKCYKSIRIKAEKETPKPHYPEEKEVKRSPKCANPLCLKKFDIPSAHPRQRFCSQKCGRAVRNKNYLARVALRAG